MMRRRHATCLLLTSAVMLTAAAKPAAERVVTDRALATQVNAAPVRLLIDPGAPAMPVLTEAAAARAGLKAGPLGVGFRVGPVQVTGRTAVGRIGLGDAPLKRRIGWTSKPYAAGYDGVVGPLGLPDRVVRFALRAAQPGERTVTLPLDEGGGLLGNWGVATGIVRIAGAPMHVRFSLVTPHTVATAGAAVALAQALRGTLDDDRQETEITFGVLRPARTLRLAQPLAIGPLTLDRLLARTGDYGNAEGIAGTGAAPDPDEIVVTAKGKRDRSRDRITIGADTLARCSSLVFDRPAKLIRLTCA